MLLVWCLLTLIALMTKLLRWEFALCECVRCSPVCVVICLLYVWRRDFIMLIVLTRIHRALVGSRIQTNIRPTNKVHATQPPTLGNFTNVLKHECLATWKCKVHFISLQEYLILICQSYHLVYKLLLCIDG